MKMLIALSMIVSAWTANAALAAPAAGDKATAYGAGTKLCSEYLDYIAKDEAYQAKTQIERVLGSGNLENLVKLMSVKTWIDGFTTAVSVQTQRHYDLEKLKNDVIQICKSRPSAKIANAALEAVNAQSRP